MALNKLRIFYEIKASPLLFNEAEPITALFNPNQINIQKTVNWRSVSAGKRDVRESQFTHGNPAVLTVDLFFDTFESRTDVRAHTDAIVHLTTVEHHGDLHRPPVCKLVWGAVGELFKGTLESLSQRFTLFLENGTPVRATLGCTFKEWRPKKEDEQRQKTASTDVVKTYTVRKRDTLSGIAGDVYNDPMQWRFIADYNGIDDPRRLSAGTILNIPVLRKPYGIVGA